MNTSVGRKPGPSLRLSLAVLLVGVVVALPPTVIIAVRAIRTIGTPSMSTPGVSHRHLTPGTWFIFQRTGTTTGAAGFSVAHNDAPTLQPSDVTVTAPDGTEPEVHFVTVNETITKGSRIYTAVVQFKATASGMYIVQVQTPDSGIIVARSLGETFRGLLGFIAVGAMGGLLVVIGGILLIVGAVRRNRVAHLQPALRSAFTNPAGWFADPSQGGRPRWWDGTQWTDHYA